MDATPGASVRPKILIVDDEDDLREELGEYLARQSFDVTGARNGREMRAAIARQSFDAMILDLRLPYEDGFTLLRELRSSVDIPCLMLTANPERVDRIVGLELGADDYLQKPVDLRELLARLRAILRRASRSAQERPDSANGTAAGADRPRPQWRLDRRQRLLITPDGTREMLTTAEFQCLACLADHQGSAVSRDELSLATFRRRWLPNDRSLDNLIVKLRRKFTNGADDEEPIRSVRGVGYVLTEIIVD
jgi:DNA-binding response OmpR family regulator